MRAFVIQDAFGLDNLTLIERNAPEPGPGELALRMRAISLNYRDLMMVKGHYNPRQPLPLVPCSDGVGEVSAVGEGVERWEVGDRVLPIFAQRWFAGEPTSEKFASSLGGPLDGTLQEQMIVSADAVVRAPENLSDVEAACLPCAALTAWSALFEQGSFGPGDTLLTLGTGGVSLFALQLAKLVGGRVIITSSSDDKLERARALGADVTINYRDEKRWGDIARKACPQRGGVDHVIEVGGAGTLPQSLRSLRHGGHISLIGVLAGTKQELDVIPVLMRNLRIQGVFVGHREGFERMNQAIARSELRPVVDRCFPFEEAPAAFGYLQEQQHMGKICLQIDD